MKRTLLFALSSLASAVALLPVANAQDIEIAVLMPNAGDPYFQSKAYGYIEEGKAQGVKVRLFNAGGYDHLADQLRQVEDLTTAKVDGMIFTPTDSVATIPTIEAAIAAGIKVVNDDIIIQDSDKIAVRVSENSFEVGQQQAELIVDAIDGKGNVVMLKGPPGIDISTQREAGAKSVFEKHPDIKIVAEEYHQSNIVEASRLMEDFIQAYPDGIDAVYTFGSQSAVGVVSAIQAAGLQPGRIKVTTIDWEPALETMVNEGWAHGSVVCEPVNLARMAVASVVKLIKGETVEPRIYTGTQKVTKSEVATFDRSGIFTPEGWNPTSLYE